MNQPLSFVPGDRVQVVHGNSVGKSGFVVEWRDDKVLVKSDRGLVKPFPPDWLEVAADPIPWDVGAEPLQAEIPDSVDSEQIEAEPLTQILTSAPTDEAQPLQALEALRESLQKNALSHAWLESAGRGYVRLVWHKSVAKPPVYVDAKDLPMVRDRITAGRALSHIDAVIIYLENRRE